MSGGGFTRATGGASGNPVTHVGVFGDALRALQQHARGEKPLDDKVVQVASDAVTFFEQRHPFLLGSSLVEPDGDACGRCQGDDETLIAFGELRFTLFLGQVQVPEHVVGHANGDAEEATHRRVVRGEPDGVRV